MKKIWFITYFNDYLVRKFFPLLIFRYQSNLYIISLIMTDWSKTIFELNKIKLTTRQSMHLFLYIARLLVVFCFSVSTFAFNNLYWWSYLRQPWPFYRHRRQYLRRPWHSYRHQSNPQCWPRSEQIKDTSDTGTQTYLASVDRYVSQIYKILCRNLCQPGLYNDSNVY